MCTHEWWSYPTGADRSKDSYLPRTPHSPSSVPKALVPRGHPQCQVYTHNHTRILHSYFLLSVQFSFPENYMTRVLLRSWVGDSSTHSTPQKDRPSPSKFQGTQLCFWGPPALASARPLLQSTRGQRPPFPSTSHCGSSMQGRAQVSRGRSETGPRVHKLLLECNCI